MSECLALEFLPVLNQNAHHHSSPPNFWFSSTSLGLNGVGGGCSTKVNLFTFFFFWSSSLILFLEEVLLLYWFFCEEACWGHANVIIVLYPINIECLGKKSIKLLYLTRDTREFIQFEPGCLAPWPRHVPFGQPPMSEAVRKTVCHRILCGKILLSKVSSRSEKMTLTRWK